jgi:predicted nuclease with TOPRIM domain
MSTTQYALVSRAARERILQLEAENSSLRAELRHSLEVVECLRREYAGSAQQSSFMIHELREATTTLEAENERLTLLVPSCRRFIESVVNQAAEWRTGPAQLEPPLWDFMCELYAYGTEQLCAIDSLTLGDAKWFPTAANITALPEPLRRYIHDLETRCDPSGDIAALTLTRDQNIQLQAENERLRSELSAAQHEAAGLDARARHAEDELERVKENGT